MIKQQSKLNLLLIAIPLLLIAGLSTSCDDTDPFSFQDDFSMVPEPYDTLSADLEVRANGLRIFTHEEGDGLFGITERDRVDLFYTFRLSDGDIVESTYANGNTFPNSMNLPTTIRGFREGLIGKKEGGTITLVIPPALGYGSDPNSPFQNDTLYYDILIDRIIE